jgi:serine/threonine protein kinase
MVGQNIGKYRVLDRVGRGGMGTVFRALDETLSREVAIKILNAELNDPEVARRFRAEAVTVARLNHPGIATIYELFQHDGQWLMVMEFVRGETLEHMVERLGPLSPQRAADLCMQGLAALSHAHRMGVVHRDLKPANIMITESGAVKIMDFGIARVAGSEHLTSAGFLMGTPAYMAPEQVTGDEIDARTDLYAFGVVFYYLVSAKLPFKGETPIAMAQSRVVGQHTPVGLVREGLPAWIEPLVDRSLSKAPADRFQSADQFREALRRGLAGLPMESVQGAVIPPELVATTPPGVVPLPAPATSGAIPAGASTSGSHPAPVGLSPAPPGTATPSVKTPALATSQTAVKGSATAPVPAPPKAAAPVAPGASGKAPAASGKAPAVTKMNMTPIALGGAALVLVVLVGGMWARSHRAPAPETSTETPAATPSASAAPAPPPPADATPTPPDVSSTTIPPLTSVSSSPTPTPTLAATTPAETPAAPRAAAPATVGATPTPPPPSSPSPSPSPTASPTPGARGAATNPAARGATPNADAELATFGDVKYLKVNGKDVDDDDAILQFVGGQMLVTSTKGGTAYAAVQYRRVSHATYVHAKMPKWDTGLPAPGDGFSVPGIGLFRPARHWLVLQTRTDFTILRLDDSNWKKILDTFEARTGLKVDQPPPGDK